MNTSQERTGPSFGLETYSETSNSDIEFGSETESEMAARKLDYTPTYINDPVHGMMEIHPLCKYVIDTPEFQRLRFIKQCGFSNFVYPGAVHTRFDHSLGTCYLARLTVRKLQEMDDIDDKISLCIQLAALCHDLGHGPFSHTWETFVKLCGGKFQHEQMSLEIFDYLCKNNDLIRRFEDYQLNEEHRQLIKDIIMGTPSKYETFTPKDYVFELVNNKRNGLDLDKYEYLLRDSYFFGVKLRVDFPRYLTGIAIYEDHIAYRDKLQMHVIDMFKDRAEMHKVAYKHKVVLKIETMLLDVLIEANQHYEIVVKKDSISYKLMDCHKNVKAMLQLSDGLFENILYSNNPDLAKAKNLAERILNRKKHYHQICSDFIERKSDVTREDLERIADELSVQFAPKFVCRERKLELGQNMKGNECHPLQNVLFIDKHNAKSQIKDRDPSLWLPIQKKSHEVFVFHKERFIEEAVEPALKLLKELND